MNVSTLKRRVLVDRETGCWLWAGSRNRHGYGTTSSGYVHRVMYELVVGPIPEGLQLDHLCRVRWCCNPDHLEPVTGAENVARAPRSIVGIAAELAARTHCKNGHEFTPENTRIAKSRTGTYRVCKTCASDRVRLHRSRH